jgi:hypothetical protein
MQRDEKRLTGLPKLAIKTVAKLGGSTPVSNLLRPRKTSEKENRGAAGDSLLTSCFL